VADVPPQIVLYHSLAKPLHRQLLPSSSKLLFLTISNRCYLCLCIQLRRCYMQISSCHCILPASLRYRPSTADTVTANTSSDRHKILTEWKIGHVKNLNNPDHVIHPLLPPPNAPSYSLRKRSHGLLLPTTQSNLLCKNFVYCMLFKDIY